MNGVIIIDKPRDWTSHDVVGKLRSVLRERRIGHGGTLDPMATGVLVVFVGRATRAAEFAESSEKEYIAHLRTGFSTDTQDITGNITKRYDRRPGIEEIREILPEFTGRILQIPPMYSALKVEGKKLYELARRGVEVERKPREIEIKSIEVSGMAGEDFVLNVTCSKGTYIRALCHDIGNALGSGGCMSYLRRTRVGAFSLDCAHTVEKVLEYAASGRAEELLIGVDALFAQYDKVTVTGRREKICRNGGEFSAPGTADGYCRVYGENGEFLMLGNASGGKIRTVKSFFEV